jgi:hypothetical protein
MLSSDDVETDVLRSAAPIESKCDGIGNVEMRPPF